MGYSEAQYAIDGILAGLNGQAKTGIEPSNVTFSIIAGNQSAKIRFVASDTVISGMVLATTKGIVLRRKIGTAPVDPTDGDLVGIYEGSELTSHVGDNPVIDSHLINNQRYYYRFFPYTGEMVYNYSSKNIMSIVPKASTIWGFHQDFSNLDPDSCITYIEDAVGYTPAHHNSDTGTVTNGSWGDWEWLNMNKPYVVGGGGQAIFQLDPTDFSKKIDGTPSNIDSLSAGSGCFSWINKIYMKEVYAGDGSSRDVYFSMENESPDTSDFLPVGFEANEGEVLEGVWLPMFYGDVNGGVKPGMLPAYTDNYQFESAGDSNTNRITNIKKIETLIKSGFGSNGYFLGGAIINVLRDILYMLYKSTNVRKHGGEGRINTATVVANHSDTSHDGQFYGRNRSAGLVNRMFYSEVLNSFQFPIIDPYIFMGGFNGLSTTGATLHMDIMPYYKKQATLKNHASPSKDTNWGDIVNVGSGVADVSELYRNSESNSTGAYDPSTEATRINDYGDVVLQNQYFNNGYAAYSPTKLVMPTVPNLPLTAEEAMASGLSSTWNVAIDAVLASTKASHARPKCGSVVRINPYGGAAAPNAGLCTGLIIDGGCRGMGLRFGGCTDYVKSTYNSDNVTPTNVTDLDFQRGQIGGDYAGIAFIAFLSPGSVYLKGTNDIRPGAGWGYSILALPPENYSPIQV